MGAEQGGLQRLLILTRFRCVVPSVQRISLQDCALGVHGAENAPRLRAPQQLAGRARAVAGTFRGGRGRRRPLYALVHVLICMYIYSFPFPALSPFRARVFVGRRGRDASEAPQALAA